jgi:hypothetical protein
MLNNKCTITFQLLRRTYPWTILIITAWRVVCSRHPQKDREKVRFLTIFAKIDFAGFMSLMNDLIW